MSYKYCLIPGPQEVEFSQMELHKAYLDKATRSMFLSVGSVEKDIHIEESARRIAHKLQAQKYHLLGQYKFDDLLLSVIQDPRARCADENILCTYLMWYIGFSDVEEDIVTILRSRLQYLTGDIADRVRVELVFRDL